MRVPARRPAGGVVRRCTTLACELSCPWCERCRGPNGPGLEPGEADKLGFAARIVRLEGGDPFADAQLDRWLKWAASIDEAETELQGPGYSLCDPAVVGRLVAAGVRRIRVMLPGVDPEQVAAWTGREGLLDETLGGIERAVEARMDVSCIVPVNRATVHGLGETILAVDGRFGGRVPVFLERAPLNDHRDDWSELEPMARELIALPEELPNGTVVFVDEMRGYAPCLFPTGAWRPGLFAERARREAPNGLAPACGECQWARSCGWRVHESVPVGAIRALSAEEAAALAPVRRGAAMDDSNTMLAEFGMDGHVCLAPWATLSLYSRGEHPVPCGKSWVNTFMLPGAVATELGVPLLSTIGNDIKSWFSGHYRYHLSDNESWPLAEIWNGPLFRRMRREMAPGGRSSRCRPSCRVLLGVEERGHSFFRIPDELLEPEVIANRRLLLREVAEGKSGLTAAPLELVVGVSAHCNITCGFCHGPKGRHGELSEKRIEEITRWLPTLMQLSVVGPGEPLMSKSFGTLLGRIADGPYPSLSVSLTTNGTLVRPSWLKRHEAVNWGSIRFSINAGSAETHFNMTGKHLWDRLMENIEATARIRDERERPFRFVLSCVLSKLIMGDLGRYAELVDRYSALPILEPMTGNEKRLSPYTSVKNTRLMGQECREVAEAWRGRNDDLYVAFDAMARYAEDRLGRKALRALKT